MDTMPNRSETSGLLERIQWILDNRELTQERLGELAGFNHRTQVGSIMSRLRKDPSMETRMAFETLHRIARGGNVSVTWLMYGQGTPEQKDPPELRRPLPPKRASSSKSLKRVGLRQTLEATTPTAVKSGTSNLEIALRFGEFNWPEYVISAVRDMNLPDRTPPQWKAVLDRFEELMSPEVKALEKNVPTGKVRSQ